MNINSCESTNTKEILCLHVGQAGCQIANSLWKTFCCEHAVGCNGCPLFDDGYDTNRGVLFSESFERFQARALYIDTECSVIDEVKRGPFRELFEDKMLFQSSGEDCGSIYARGYFQINAGFLKTIFEKIYHLLEKCDRPSGFLCNRSLGGGTGSGLGSRILEYLGDEFIKIPRLEFNICTSNHLSTSPLEPYNSILGLESSCSTGDLTSLVDNEALFRRVTRTIHPANTPYSQVNKICSSAMSSLLSCVRFPGAINLDINTLLTNLIPYPRIHFPIINFSTWPESGPTCLYEDINVQSENRNCLFSENCLLNLSPLDGRYVSCCMLYRGMFWPRLLARNLLSLKYKKAINFVDWVPASFKISHSYVPPSGSYSYTPQDLSLTVISNNSEIAHFLKMQAYRFANLFKKKAFVHWYIGDNLELDDFKSAMENIKTLELDYNELNQPLSNKISRERSINIIQANLQEMMRKVSSSDSIKKVNTKKSSRSSREMESILYKLNLSEDSLNYDEEFDA